MGSCPDTDIDPEQITLQAVLCLIIHTQALHSYYKAGTL